MENWLQKRVLLSPQKVAISTNRENLTFTEVMIRVKKLANKLMKYNLDCKRVGLLTNNTLEGYLLILTLQQLDATIVLLNKRLSHMELCYQLEDAQVSMLIYDESLQDTKFTGINSLSFKELFQQISEETEAPLVKEFSDEKVTTIMYTSGTTGKPKGVQQTFKNHFYSAIGSALNLGVTSQDNWLCAVPIFHISGLSIIMRSLIYGMTITLVEKFDAKKVSDLLITKRITAISVVPTMLKQLLVIQKNIQYNSAFRCFLLGGGPIDRDTLHKCKTRNWVVIQSYGMTETASQVVALNFEDAERKLGSVGKPLFPVEMKLAEDGEVLFKAPNITPGYYNAIKKNELSFEKGWFKTGDIGYCDDEGFLYLKGRKGDMIISGGENIFPHEIEDCYYKLPEIKEIVVTGIADNHWGQVPIAFIKATEDISEKNLLNYGRKHLAHYKVPKKFYKVTDYPRTASGKIKRHLLNELAKYQKSRIQ